MSLSDKIKQLGLIEAFEANDVKKFIKELKKEIKPFLVTSWISQCINKIDKLAGEKLVEATK